mmetsp:Transcript_45432/g.98902  ORF Transcript_45432/g.98902 Transcript_45432/m.98902 type:complete len:86 (-) Transcript_45432:578-835(-)
MRDRMRTNAFDARAALSEVLARELMRASLRATLYGCARTVRMRSKCIWQSCNLVRFEEHKARAHGLACCEVPRSPETTRCALLGG